MATITAQLPPASPPMADYPRATPDDLLKLEERGLFELVDGHLVEKRMASEANWIAGRITYHLTAHVLDTEAGEVLPEQTYLCFPDDPAQTRRPDVSLLLSARVPRPWPTGHLTVRPDLAVEVVSPNDSAIELELKLDDYRSAGIPLVWVVFPDVRLIRVHKLGGPLTEVRAGEMLQGDPVLPTFSVPVADLFPPQTTTAT